MSQHVCPWWKGYFLASPIRKLSTNPKKILSPYIKPGMKILEVGPGMGFFTIPMAQMLNNKGKIYAVDLQDKMLSALNKNIRKKQLNKIVETRLCNSDSLNIQDLKDQIDLAVLFYVVHEAKDQLHFFQQIKDAMKPGGQIFIIEPKGHVPEKNFEEMIKILTEPPFAFGIDARPIVHKSYSVVVRV